MVKNIMRDPLFLSQKSEIATKEDLQVGRDLMDTLRANRERCVGMAANMIGVKKNIIIVNMGFIDVVMFNPVIVSKSDPFETEEGCLSLDGVRKTVRYQNIEVEYYDFAWKKQRQKLSGWTAQIVQHEVDHLSGILIQETASCFCADCFSVMILVTITEEADGMETKNVILELRTKRGLSQDELAEKVMVTM